MKKRYTGGDGGEEDFYNTDRAELELKSSHGADGRPVDLGTGKRPENYGKSDNYEDLIKAELDNLSAIAYRRIYGKCSDPSDHKWDVVYEGIKNFLQSVGKRESGYETPAKVLRAAVWQVGVRHSQTCPREQAVDFNAPPRQHDESRDGLPFDLHARELNRKTSYNPLEAYNKLVELKQRLLGVSDITLFVRYFEEGKTLAEIARERGCSVPAVQRALQRLKKELGLNGDDDDGGPPTLDPDE